jgi:hypothetical protein
LDAEHPLPDLLDAYRNAIAVHWFGRQRFQDQHI